MAHRLNERAGRALALAALAAAGWGSVPAQAQSTLPGGCPAFHCSPEALGVINGNLIDQPTVVTTNASLGQLRFQGCSGDGVRLSCLYSKDLVTGDGQGTLKVLDASSLTPIWGSVSAPGSYDPVAKETSGQVPTHFADGRLAAGDNLFEVLYDLQGMAVASVPLSGRGNNFGLTVLTPTRGIVSQDDAVLTLINLSTWEVLHTLSLRDPDGGRVNLVSPSSGSVDTLYVMTRNNWADRGVLFAVSLGADGQSLVERAHFGFDGRSGASPIVLPPLLTGLPDRLVVMHAPSLEADGQDWLIALADDGGGTLTPAWSVALEASMPVSPTVDLATRTLFVVHRDDRRLFRHDMLTGALTATYDLQSETGLDGHVELNGHLVTAYDGVRSTLLLSAAVDSSPSGLNGQYVMAFSPDTMPRLRWIERIATRADNYTGAWSVAPSLDGSSSCPVVVGSRSGLTRLCDF